MLKFNELMNCFIGSCLRPDAIYSVLPQWLYQHATSYDE